MTSKNCIVCGKPATRCSGHVHTEIGLITAGWCDEHLFQSERPRSKRCTSSNPNSCGGEYKLSEIELIEELSEDNLLEHRKNEEFSEMIDRACSPYHPYNIKR